MHVGDTLSYTRYLLGLQGFFIVLHFGLIWIQLSGTSVFLHLKGRQHPTILTIQSSFGLNRNSAAH
jgi:hypothetical protein